MRCTHGCRADEHGIYHVEQCEATRLISGNRKLTKPSSDYMRGWQAALAAVRTFGIKALHDLEYDATLSAIPTAFEAAATAKESDG